MKGKARKAKKEKPPIESNLSRGKMILQRINSLWEDDAACSHFNPTTTQKVSDRCCRFINDFEDISRAVELSTLAIESKHDFPLQRAAQVFNRE